jgi:hypothetical protein
LALPPAVWNFLLKAAKSADFEDENTAHEWSAQAICDDVHKQYSRSHRDAGESY